MTGGGDGHSVLAELPGDLMMWVLIISELLVFGAGLAGFLAVRAGDRVSAGEVIGHVGGDESSAAGTHVEFQIYEPGGDGSPRQVDPVRWLRGRS